jgi:AcrR family transcriptional regulator
MIEIVAERGYEAVTVRDLAACAGVSTRTFYQHYTGKEQCFLRTHELIVRRVFRCLASSQAGPSDATERMRRAIEVLVDGWSRDRRAARLMLIDVYTAGPRAVEQARRAICTIEELVGESLEAAIGKREVPTLLIEGVVAAITGVVRSHLLADKRWQAADLSDELAQWTISCCSPLIVQLADLDIAAESRVRQASSRPGPSSRLKKKEGSTAPIGAVTLLLSAAAKLAAADGYESLTPKRILAAAGVPRRSFYANFSNAEDCLVTAFELQAGEAIAEAERAGKTKSTAADGVHQAVSSLCARISQDIIFANLCFSGIGAVGPAGDRCRERLMADVGALMAKHVPEGDADGLAIEASVAATWGLLGKEVAMGRARQVHRSVAMLTYLLLAPIIGASAAVETVLGELNPTREDTNHYD